MATGAANAGHLEQSDVQRRVVAAPLVLDEPGQHRDADQDRAPGHRAAEAVLAAVDDAVGEGDQADHGEQHAEHVDPAGPRVTRLGDQQRHQDHAGNDHRHVDQEDRAPPEVLQQRAAEDRADRHGETDRTGPDPDGPTTLARVEDVGDDRQRHRHDGRAADPHQGAGRDELAGALGVRGEQRRQAEQHQTDHQEALAAGAVAEHPEGEQQPGEDQRVGVDGPLQLALAGAEAVHRVGQRAQGDVEDRVVEDDHEEADHQHPEDRPPPRVSGVVVQLHA